VINDSRLASLLEQAAIDVLGHDHVTRIEQPSLGGEDFAFYTQQLPGAMLRLGCTPPGATPHYLHSARFDIDERCLPLGTRILLRAAISAS
jgi:metal-dependent amidase/aminoacylase/carboxypeptidase family protein